MADSVVAPRVAARARSEGRMQVDRVIVARSVWVPSRRGGHGHRCGCRRRAVVGMIGMIESLQWRRFRGEEWRRVGVDAWVCSHVAKCGCCLPIAHLAALWRTARERSYPQENVPTRFVFLDGKVPPDEGYTLRIWCSPARGSDECRTPRRWRHPLESASDYGPSPSAQVNRPRGFQS
jgi:hypothetical protein